MMGNDRHTNTYNNNNINYNNNNTNISSWRRPKEDNVHGNSKPRSSNNNSRRPPLGRQQSIRQMEELFCETVGGLSWRELVVNQRYMYQYENILQWKDSAAQDAFWNAKKRFWAKMHHQPCDVQLPDPDIFIDKIDWNPSIDPELMSDLEKEPDVSCEKQDGDVVVEIPVVLDQSGLTVDGWGDTEDVEPQSKRFEKQDQYGNEHWVDNGVDKEDKGCPTGWGDNNSYDTRNMANHGDCKDNGSEWRGSRNQWEYDQGNVRDHKDGNQWDHGDHRNRGDNGWNTSRYKISRYPHNNYNNSSFDGDHRSKKGNPSYQRPVVKWKPVARQY